MSTHAATICVDLEIEKLEKRPLILHECNATGDIEGGSKFRIIQCCGSRAIYVNIADNETFRISIDQLFRAVLNARSAGGAS
jgi:hypothetical protein